MERLGFLEWKDPYEWTEIDPVARTHAIQEENRLFKHTVTASGGNLKEMRAAFMAAYNKTEQNHRMKIPLDGAPPQIIVESRIDLEGLYYWKYVGEREWKYADDLDVDFFHGTPYIVFTYDSSRGKLDYDLHVKTPNSQWTHKRVGGMDVAIMNHRVYFIEADAPLHYNRLVSLSLYTGEKRRIIYEEANPGMELSLVKAENRALYLLGENAGHQQLRWITPRGAAKRLEPGGISFFPVGCSGTNPIYFVRLHNFANPWKLVGASWKLNAEIENSGIEFCWFAIGILITKFQGIRTVWSMSSDRAPKRLDRGFFSVLSYSMWPLWRGERNTQIWVYSPIAPPYVLNEKGGMNPYADFKTGEAISSDGMPVQWLLVHGTRQKKTRGLMLSVYGAYGLISDLNTTRWRPWLDAGWAVAIVFVRGGGDSNEAWAELGRLGGKLQAVSDMEACCKDLQKRTGCGPDRTCIFGRSAGGLIIGNLISKHPRGELFKCVYAEAPYVDLLKTASNPKLPLTEYEYREFGNPRASPADFEQTLRMSPIHTLPSSGAPGVHVLCRSGERDIQVYPYESLKWILTLRGKRKDTTKILHVNSQAHHTYGGELYTEYAEDFLIINHWLK